MFVLIFVAKALEQSRQRQPGTVVHFDMARILREASMALRHFYRFFVNAAHFIASRAFETACRQFFANLAFANLVFVSHLPVLQPRPKWQKFG